ncbi:MAG: helix-turn-helix domain-containing protein [Thiohalocapsa sp.]
MPLVLPKPKSITTDEVVLSRTDWEQLVLALEDRDEDADDIAAVMAARRDDAALAARLEAERGCPVETTIPLKVVMAELDGAHPLKAWREYRGWTAAEASAKSGIARDVIEEIETRRNSGSIQMLNRLARVLNVPIEALIEDEGDEDGNTGEP